MPSGDVFVSRPPWSKDESFFDSVRMAPDEHSELSGVEPFAWGTANLRYGFEQARVKTDLRSLLMRPLAFAGKFHHFRYRLSR